MSGKSSPYVARPQVAAAHYRPSRYLTPKRMASIGHQLQAVATHFPGASVLEIGGGGGLTRQLLREEGHHVIASDLDPALRPDVLAALPRLPLRDIHRVCTRGAVISVPTVRKAAALTVFGQVRDGSRSLELPSLGRGRVRNTKEHHWELEAGVRLRQFRAALDAAGFAVADSFRPASCMYHHFFVLEKR